MSIKINDKNARQFFGEHEITYLSDSAIEANSLLHSGKGAGSDFLGWVSLPSEAKKNASSIEEVAREIRENAEVLVVVGIGGSYLGARAVIEAFISTFSTADAKKGSPAIIYAGQNISGTYHRDILNFLEGKDFYVNVISKSGTTTEPAIAFRMLKEYTEKRYGKDASKHIIATTDEKKGALRTLATEEGYRTFVIPNNVGGRFSVLTPVGLLPVASAGIDISSMLDGASSMEESLSSSALEKNIALHYASLRNVFYRKGFTTEILVNYIPRMHFVAEWWKQLYGESEGKDNKGIFPASVDFTTDLHSLGQYIQEGRRNIFETVMRVEKEAIDLSVGKTEDDLDGLNYLFGRGLHEVNNTALMATVLAHVDGGVPNIILEIDEINAYTFGELLYFFEKACGISGYMLGVNPFDQPGVEAYKKNMFALLGKPGHEEETRIINERIGL